MFLPTRNIFLGSIECCGIFCWRCDNTNSLHFYTLKMHGKCDREKKTVDVYQGETSMAQAK